MRIPHRQQAAYIGIYMKGVKEAVGFYLVIITESKAVGDPNLLFQYGEGRIAHTSNPHPVFGDGVGNAMELDSFSKRTFAGGTPRVGGKIEEGKLGPWFCFTVAVRINIRYAHPAYCGK